MHRFRVDAADVESNFLTLRDREAHHLTRVLRLAVGDEILAFDESGLEYLARIMEIKPGAVTGEILHRTESHREPPLDVYLLQGLPKADKMELIVQKTTELGVRAITPLQTRRAVVQLAGKKALERVARWQKIAVEAAKQCGRSKVPSINPVSDLATAIKALPENTLLLAAYEGETTQGLAEILTGWRGVPIALVVGPEGGFAETEIAFLKEKGAHSVSLGPRILRTETAGLAALTMVLFSCGDLGKV